MSSHRHAFAVRLAVGGFGLLGLVAGSGCPRRPPALVPPEERVQDAATLLELGKQRGQRLAALRAAGTVMVRRASERIKARVTLLARRPANLRFESESFFDSPISILVTDGMRFSLWDMQKGQLLVGPATPANIGRVIPVPMDGPEVVGLLLGDPPLILHTEAKLTYDEGDRCYHLLLTNPRQEQRIRFDARRFAPEEVTLSEGGKPIYQLWYEDWRDGPDGSAMVGRLRFDMPAEGIQMDLKLRELEGNPSLEDKLFVLEPPPDVEVLQVVDP